MWYQVFADIWINGKIINFITISIKYLNGTLCILGIILVEKPSLSE